MKKIVWTATLTMLLLVIPAQSDAGRREGGAVSIDRGTNRAWGAMGTARNTEGQDITVTMGFGFYGEPHYSISMTGQDVYDGSPTRFFCRINPRELPELAAVVRAIGPNSYVSAQHDGTTSQRCTYVGVAIGSQYEPPSR